MGDPPNTRRFDAGKTERLMPDDPAQLRDWIVHATSDTADEIGP